MLKNNRQLVSCKLQKRLLSSNFRFNSIISELLGTLVRNDGPAAGHCTASRPHVRQCAGHEFQQHAPARHAEAMEDTRALAADQQLRLNGVTHLGGRGRDQSLANLIPSISSTFLNK